jgi:D-alanyl-lipoteichoic acid acyltransferase DltB (MBOAT superfamily)
VSSISFSLLLFAFIAAIIYNLRSSVGWRQAALMAANLCFLATFSLDPLAWLPFAGFVGFAYVGIRLAQAGVRSAFWPFLAGTIAAFIWLKKYTFLPSSSFLHISYVVIGLSYIFFRVLHLMIDIRGGLVREPIGLVSYLNYVLNFTALVSGPIQRFPDFAATHLRLPRPPLDLFMIGEAVQRVIVGFFKVTVLSQGLSILQERAINLASREQPLALNACTAAVIAASYPIYLYCNFSGYMDVVIGLARFFRFDLPENFNRPFSAHNFIDFWNRWHITLSSWLKVYVYNPLLIALMRRAPSAALAPWWGILAYFVTFFLIGIWHGQTSEFAAYGVVLGLGVSLNKLFQVATAKILGRERNRSLQANPFYNALSRGLTFAWFAFCLVFFWSNWKQMGEILQKLNPAAFAVSWLVIFAGATVVLAAYEAMRGWAVSPERPGIARVSSRYARVVYCTVLVFVSLVVLALGNLPAPKIVYKAF